VEGARIHQKKGGGGGGTPTYKLIKGECCGPTGVSTTLIVDGCTVVGGAARRVAATSTRSDWSWTVRPCDVGAYVGVWDGVGGWCRSGGGGRVGGAHQQMIGIGVHTTCTPNDHTINNTPSWQFCSSRNDEVENKAATDLMR
jgi:hypothetical protein